MKEVCEKESSQDMDWGMYYLDYLEQHFQILTKTIVPALQRTAGPILKHTVKHVGESLLKSSGNVLSDVVVLLINLQKCLERTRQSVITRTESKYTSKLYQPACKKKKNPRKTAKLVISDLKIHIYLTKMVLLVIFSVLPT
jgi:hypothetical protein